MSILLWTVFGLACAVGFLAWVLREYRRALIEAKQERAGSEAGQSKIDQDVAVLAGAWRRHKRAEEDARAREERLDRYRSAALAGLVSREDHDDTCEETASIAESYAHAMLAAEKPAGEAVTK